eukprot:GEZU01005486.1.p1 GENE.GEZU01005486.1~~GEZU01005486.1.p1  ORF type:complete len:345 (-),score=41.74 GEZU01005486.1:214-1248(-)
MIAAKYRSKFLRSLVRAKINTNNHIPALVANRIFTSSLRVASATQPPNSQPQQRLAINPEKCTTTATTRRIFSSTRALLDNKKAFRSQEQYEKEQEQELAKELPQTKTITAQNLSFEKISQGRHDITFNWAKVPLQVSLLGLLSPLPATYFALQVAMSGNAEFFMGMHQTYAAVLLSFIGAIHWGTVIPKMQSMFDAVVGWLVGRSICIHSLCIPILDCCYCCIQRHAHRSGRVDCSTTPYHYEARHHSRKCHLSLALGHSSLADCLRGVCFQCIFAQRDHHVCRVCCRVRFRSLGLLEGMDAAVVPSAEDAADWHHDPFHVACTRLLPFREDHRRRGAKVEGD